MRQTNYRKYNTFTDRYSERSIIGSGDGAVDVNPNGEWSDADYRALAAYIGFDAACPAHFGYRCGRRYYGHRHQWGCERGGNGGAADKCGRD